MGNKVNLNPPRLPEFEVKSKACGFQTEVDVLRLNQLADELELEDFKRKQALTLTPHTR